MPMGMREGQFIYKTVYRCNLYTALTAQAFWRFNNRRLLNFLRLYSLLYNPSFLKKQLWKRGKPQGGEPLFFSLCLWRAPTPSPKGKLEKKQLFFFSTFALALSLRTKARLREKRDKDKDEKSFFFLFLSSGPLLCNVVRSKIKVWQTSD